MQPHPGIVVVEDEPIVAIDIEAQLTRFGYRVMAVAGSAAQAVAFTAIHHPDLVLMDIGLHGPTDGIAAAQEIRKQWQVPVLFLTGHSSDDTIRRAAQTVPSGFVLKPFRPEALHASITMALQQHQQVQEAREFAERQLDAAKADWNAQLRVLSQSFSRERQQLARTLRNEVGLRMAALEMRVRNLLASAHTSPASLLALENTMAELREVNGLLQQAVQQIGTEVRDAATLQKGLRNLAADYERFGGILKLSIRSLPPSLSSDAAAALYIVAQEALHNVQQHAPRAAVTVSLAQRRGTLLLAVRDQGPGFAIERLSRAKGRGIAAMQERMRLAGGTLVLTAKPGHGCVVEAILPHTTVSV